MKRIVMAAVVAGSLLSAAIGCQQQASAYRNQETDSERVQAQDLQRMFAYRK